MLENKKIIISKYSNKTIKLEQIGNKCLSFFVYENDDLISIVSASEILKLAKLNEKR